MMFKLLIIFLLVPVVTPAQSEFYTLKFYDTTKVKANVLNKEYSVEIGDSTLAGFVPSLEITAWRGGCKMRVNLSTVNHPMESASRNVGLANGKDRVTLSTASVSHDMFAKNETEFEWHIILNKKPDTNVFTYDFESKGFRYFYHSDPVDTGNLPDSENGCYFVMHSTKRDNYRYLYPKDTIYENYMTGIAFAIWRPKAWDAVGKDTVWCLLNIDEQAGNLSVTVPQKFLDNAVYPVVIDPTFGQTSTGTFGNIGNINDYVHKANVAGSWHHTAGAGEVLDTVYYYGQEQVADGGATIKVAVYEACAAPADTSACARLYKSGALPLPNTAAWVKGITDYYPLINGTTYIMAYGNATFTGAKHSYIVQNGTCYDLASPTLENPHSQSGCTAGWIGACYAFYSISVPDTAGQFIMIQQ